jgi:hypothetical protein
MGDNMNKFILAFAAKTLACIIAVSFISYSFETPTEAQQSREIRVTVLGEDGYRFFIKGDALETVASLKNKIGREIGKPANKFGLLHRQGALQPGSKLKDTPIINSPEVKYIICYANTTFQNGRCQ